MARASTKNEARVGKVTAGYSGTPLPKKLGIKPDSTLVLVNAPEDFDRTLGELPENVRVKRRVQGRAKLCIWFVESSRDLDRRLASVLRIAEGGNLWIAWPKKSSGVATDLDGNAVRFAGLAAGWVDFKVCAIDATWSGLKFAKRKGA